MIDRKKLVSRHNPKINQLHKLSPLSVGNGNFAFTADITGLQTFPNDYDVPLGTQSQWGWHSTNGHNYHTLDDISFQTLDSHGREVAYPIYPEENEKAYHWLRQNPHRLQLGQISFQMFKENGEEVQAKDIQEVNQELDLWSGVLFSQYKIEGTPVSVKTVCHPTSDQLGVYVSSPLITNGRLKVKICFPSPNMTSKKWEESIRLNWNNKDHHHSKITQISPLSAKIDRSMDQDSYTVSWAWSSGMIKQVDDHEFVLVPERSAHDLTFTIGFAKKTVKNAPFNNVYDESRKYWKKFWTTGGAIDFSESSDPRAHELERRVVLSQFLIDIHSSGFLPPQETGLLYNSWFGKFHLEMHWWHAANLPIWGRGKKLATSLDWYVKILPQAKELAKSQGYQGARWPKQVGPDGRQSPSEIATVLIWQQPHPIFLAELCYRENPNQQTLKRWKEIIVETANFMTSFAQWDEQKNAYVLGPPIIPAQECFRPEDSMNPAFELEYWKYGLAIATLWLQRLGEPVNSKWSEVANSMAKPPHKDGVYLAHENCPNTFQKYNRDHPSMVGALGILPGSLVEKSLMKNTLVRVYHEWKWETSWGWDFPMCAMTAVRLGEGELAVDFLLMDVTKNTYLPNGHNYQDSSLTAYLPGNGGLLTAVAMMATGWHGSEDMNSPGFPQDGSWVVRHEGIHPIL